MRRFLKFLHTTSSIGLAGGLISIMIMLETGPSPNELEAYAALRATLATLSNWLIVPSMALCLFSGVVALAVHAPFHNRGWAWLKAVTGILVLEATLASIDAPLESAAIKSAQALEGALSVEQLTQQINDKWVAWWVLLVIFAVNIALAIWRPRFAKDLGRRSSLSTTESSSSEVPNWIRRPEQ